jgi:hypothetical protein
VANAAAAIAARHSEPLRRLVGVRLSGHRRLDSGRLDRLPLHVRWAITTPLVEGHEMVHDVPWASVRIAGLVHKLLLGLGIALDVPMAITGTGRAIPARLLSNG